MRLGILVHYNFEDGGSRFLRNIGTYLPKYTALHAKRYIVMFFCFHGRGEDVHIQNQHDGSHELQFTNLHKIYSLRRERETLTYALL
jgi:hypothetical protein